MRFKECFKAAAIAAIFTSSVAAQAAVHCSEKITKAILHANGEVYFHTDQTCSGNWCQITWDTSEKKKNALAMLLTAKAGDRAITFYWPSINACGEKNVVYASPSYMMLD